MHRIEQRTHGEMAFHRKPRRTAACIARWRIERAEFARDIERRKRARVRGGLRPADARAIARDPHVLQ